MNGTSVMTGILTAQIKYFERLLLSFESFCAGLFEAMEADTTAIEPFVHEIKPFKGQIKCAKKPKRKITRCNIDTR